MYFPKLKSRIKKKTRTFSLNLHSDPIKFKYAIGTKGAPILHAKYVKSYSLESFYGHVEYHEKTLAESLKQTSQPKIPVNEFSMKMKNIEREKNEFEITKFIDGTIYHFLS